MARSTHRFFSAATTILVLFSGARLATAEAREPKFKYQVPEFVDPGGAFLSGGQGGSVPAAPTKAAVVTNPPPAPPPPAPPAAKPPAPNFGNAIAGIVNRLTGSKKNTTDGVGFGYDENAKKEEALKPAPGKEEGRGGDRPRAIPLPYYLPYCFLVDPSFPEATVNTQIKTIVDTYATCGIVVDVWATTIQANYPADPPGLQAAARRQCDFSGAFGTRGSIMIMSQYAQQPAAMCQEQGATGCSTLCERLSTQILAPGTGAGTALHESLHGNCCGRICVNQGEGSIDIGAGIAVVQNENKVLKKFWAEEGAGNYDNNLNQAVCPTLQAGAARNNGSRLWDRQKARYYARANDPERQWNIMGQQTFIGPPLPVREPIAPPKDGQSPSNPDVSQNKGPAGPSKNLLSYTPIEQGYAHRNKHPVGGAQALLSSVRGGPANLPPGMNSPYESGSRPILKGYGYDDSAAKEKSQGSSSGSNSGSSVVESPSGGSGFGYDEGATKEVASSGSGGSGSPSAKGGGSYGYDEGAGKVLGGSGGNAGAALKNQLGFARDGSGLSDDDLARMQLGKTGYGKARKRGQALQRTSDGRKKSLGLPRQSDALISQRPEPDFQVDSAPAQDAGAIYQ